MVEEDYHRVIPVEAEEDPLPPVVLVRGRTRFGTGTDEVVYVDEARVGRGDLSRTGRGVVIFRGGAGSTDFSFFQRGDNSSRSISRGG